MIKFRFLLTDSENPDAHEINLSGFAEDACHLATLCDQAARLMYLPALAISDPSNFEVSDDGKSD